jgi:hypothetical protein
MTALEPLFSVDEAAELAGMSASVLRAWESRYGWPRPARAANGYRLYSAAQVDDLKRMNQLLAMTRQVEGRDVVSPQRFIADGLPRWPDTHSLGSPRWHRLDELERPRTDDGKRFREQLVSQLRQRHLPRLLEQLHHHVYLHAAERAPACWLPAYVGACLWLQAGRPLDARFLALLRRLAGDDRVRQAQAVWLVVDA